MNLNTENDLSVDEEVLTNVTIDAIENDGHVPSRCYVNLNKQPTNVFPQEKNMKTVVTMDDSFSNLFTLNINSENKSLRSKFDFASVDDGKRYDDTNVDSSCDNDFRSSIFKINTFNESDSTGAEIFEMGNDKKKNYTTASLSSDTEVLLSQDAAVSSSNASIGSANSVGFHSLTFPNVFFNIIDGDIYSSHSSALIVSEKFLPDEKKFKKFSVCPYFTLYECWNFEARYFLRLTGSNFSYKSVILEKCISQAFKWCAKKNITSISVPLIGAGHSLTCADSLSIILSSLKSVYFKKLNLYVVTRGGLLEESKNALSSLLSCYTDGTLSYGKDNHDYSVSGEGETARDTNEKDIEGRKGGIFENESPISQKTLISSRIIGDFLSDEKNIALMKESFNTERSTINYRYPEKKNTVLSAKNIKDMFFGSMLKEDKDYSGIKITLCNGKRMVGLQDVPSNAIKGAIDATCCICFRNNQSLISLSCCKELLCKECNDTWFKDNSSCPYCRKIIRVSRGPQPPNGKIKVSKDPSKSLPGFDDCGTITITYTFPSGNHKDVGFLQGIVRVAYLPCNDKGERLLKGLLKSFHLGHTFTVGRSMSSGSIGITWNDIHHKTSRTGGPDRYGYPDYAYLDRLERELLQRNFLN